MAESGEIAGEHDSLTDLVSIRIDTITLPGISASTA